MFARLSGTMRYRGTRIGVVAMLAAAGVTG